MLINADGHESWGMHVGLFSSKSARGKRLRELIVDLQPPVVGTDDSDSNVGPDGQESSGLNAEQQRAVDR